MENKEPTISNENSNEINGNLYNQIRDFVVKTGKADFFDIDRGLNLGLSSDEMSRYFELLEKQGVILNGPNPRIVLVKQGDLIPVNVSEQDEKKEVPPVEEKSTHVESPDLPEFTEEEYKKVGDYVIDRGNSDPDELAVALGVDRQKIVGILDHLVEHGLIEVEDPSSANPRKLRVTAMRHTPLPAFPFKNEKSSPIDQPSGRGEAEKSTETTPQKERVLLLEQIKDMYDFTVLTAMAALLKEEMENEKDIESRKELKARRDSLKTEMEELEKKIKDEEITDEDYKNPKNSDAMKALALADAIACNERVIANTNKMAELTNRQDQPQTEGREYSPRYFTKGLARPDSLLRVSPMTPDDAETIPPPDKAPIEEPTGNLPRNSGFVFRKTNIEDSVVPETETPETSLFIDPGSYKNPYVRAQAEDTVKTILFLKKRIPDLEQIKLKNTDEEHELYVSKFVLDGLESETAQQYYSVVDSIGAKSDLLYKFLDQKEKAGGSDNMFGFYYKPLIIDKSLQKYLEELLSGFGAGITAEARWKAFSDALEEYSATLKK